MLYIITDPFENEVFAIYILRVESFKYTGVDPERDLYPFQYLTRGMAYVIIPPYCEKLTIFCINLYKYSDIINRFCSKNGLIFNNSSKILSKISPKMQNFGQSGSKNLFFYPSPALNLHLKVFAKLHNSCCKNTQFSSFWGGTSPLRHPPVHASMQLALTHHKIIPYAPVQVTLKCSCKI